MTKSLAAFEGDLTAHDGERTKLLREVAAARDLAVQLQKSKDDLQKQMIAQAAEGEYHKQKAQRLEKDNAALTAQLRDQVFDIFITNFIF